MSPRPERPDEHAAEHRITVPRSARYYVRGDAEPARQVWLVCHGYGQLAQDFIADFAVLPQDVRVVAPEALNRYYLGKEGVHGPDSPVGATWMTRVDRLAEIGDQARYLDLVYDEAIAPAFAPVTALGFSQGAATIARWAARTDRRVARLVLWGSGVPPDLHLGADTFRGVPLLLVAGRRDRDPERTAAGLRGLGLQARTRTFEGGHRLDDDTLRDLARMDS